MYSHYDCSPEAYLELTQTKQDKEKFEKLKRQYDSRRKEWCIGYGGAWASTKLKTKICLFDILILKFGCWDSGLQNFRMFEFDTLTFYIHSYFFVVLQLQAYRT